MRNVLVGLLWLWVAVSLTIYGYRLYRRFTRGPKDDLSSPGTLPEQGPLVDGGHPEVAPPRPSVPPSPAVAPDSPQDSARDPESAAGTRSGLFAVTPSVDAASAPVPRPPRSEARPTVAEMLSGITMPCDLSPIVRADQRIDPYRVAFSTDTTPAARVGAGVGDELERLGFALMSTATNQLEATKGDARLTVTIHTDPAAVTVGEEPAYPTMPTGSVVVEFQS